MAEFRVKKGRLISSAITVPGDKSISHRAVMIAALSNGRCVIDGFLSSEDCRSTIEAFRMMGVRIDVPGDSRTPAGAKRGALRIVVHGRRRLLDPPAAALDCGNSGTTMRLMCGILAGQLFRSELIGDASLSRRPMNRVIEPLALMGADIRSTGDRQTCPLAIHGRPLLPITYTLPVASAQVKSAILLAGLLCKGKTTVIEPVATRDHTERMLDYFLVKTLRAPSLEGRGTTVTIYGGQIPESRDLVVPGDISSAAFWIAAAAAQPGSELHVQNVGLNPTRTGILKVLTRMGAQISEVIETTGGGEPTGHVVVRGTRLRGTTIGGNEIPTLIDELPILAVTGALASGRTVIRDAQELRVKESDRIATVARHLRAMGADVRETEDGMEMAGDAVLRAPKSPLPSAGDHRIAMAFAIAGLFAEGETVIDDVECVETSYPGFAAELRRFQTHAISEGIVTPVLSHLPVREPPVSPPARGPKSKRSRPPRASEPPPPAESENTMNLFSEGREERNLPRDRGEGFASFVAGQTEAPGSQSVSGIIVAIDGPAASGKSSVARNLARRMGFVHVNSGAMYRAVTWAALDRGVPVDDGPAVAALLDRLELESGLDGQRAYFRIAGRDPGDALHSPAVNEGVSAIAGLAEVRERLVNLQRQFAGRGNIVMEGRDIGSVVFPSTPFKYYIDARPDVRAKRRAAQGLDDPVAERDHQDSSRPISPLTRAEDAMVVDSSNLTIDQVVETIATDLERRLRLPPTA